MRFLWGWVRVLSFSSLIIWTHRAAASFGAFDIIISNPPYIESSDIAPLDAEVREFDPRGALDGGSDGLDHYHRLADVTRSWLRPPHGRVHEQLCGQLFLEVGSGQAESVSEMLRQNGWGEVVVFKDLAGVERTIGARWLGQSVHQ